MHNGAKEGDLMKYSIMPLILVIICVTLTACNAAPAGPDGDAANNGLNSAPPTAGSLAEPPVIADDNAAIRWVEPALEALIRKELDKQEGDIFSSDLDHIRVIKLLGDTHIAINVNPFGSSIDLHNFDNTGMPLKDGTYELYEHQYTRGSISSLADFANFRNIEDLRIYKNDLRDLRGLASLKKLELFRLNDCAIQSIEDLAQLRQIDYLDLQSNQISDISPLCNLDQLSQLHIGNNNISNLDKLSSLKNLQFLSVDYNPIENIDFIKELEKVTYFGLSGTKVEDISILAEKTDMKILHLQNMDVKKVDLTPLKNLKKLHFLNVRQNKAELLNLHAIAELKSLNLGAIIIAPNDINITEEDITWLREQFPNCQIISNSDQIII
jgi:Leucine-rich repeat (LRR) protein